MALSSVIRTGISAIVCLALVMGFMPIAPDRAYAEGTDEYAAQGASSSDEKEASDMADSWRYEDGERIEAETESSDSGDSGDNQGIQLFSAERASQVASWKKANGTTSYAYGSGKVTVKGVKRVGIDVSYHNGTIDWKKVKSDGISYAIIRCGYGSNYSNQDDTQFLANVKGALANGIDIGVYLYSYAKETTGKESAKSEAQHVLRLLQKAGLEPDDLALPVFYDLEENSQAKIGAKKIGSLAKTFCDTISAQGYKVGIYANLNWWTNYLTDSVFDSEGWYKWVARYPGANKATDCGVSDADMWQFSDCGTVSGIKGEVDMDFDYTVSYEAKAVQGWRQSGGYWYWYDANGQKATGWLTVSGQQYHFDSKGRMQTGWQKLSEKWYYFNSSGAMATGWEKVSGKWYYLNSSGVMQTGWEQVSGKWYYLDKSGAMKTGWQKVSKKWYYLNSSGAMATGWKKVSGKWYYLNSSGAMQTGWEKVSGKWYYLSSSGAMKTGWLKTGGKWYYLNSSGAMVTGKHKINGKIYTFSSSGVLK